MAFEWINHKANHGCSYLVCLLPVAADVAVALAERFKVKPVDVRVEAIANVDDELRNVFRRFLFLFQDLHGDHLEGPHRSFSLMYDFGRDELLDELASVM